MTTVDARRYYYGLDIVRFLAAVLVVFYHLGYSVWANKNSAFSSVLDDGYSLELFSGFTWFGWIGVEIFFVISGFVICQSASKYGLYKFVQSRFVRLYPAIWIIAPISFFSGLYLGLFDFSDASYRLVKTLLIIPIHPWIDPVYWTLAIEVVFYVFVAFFIAIGRWRLIFSWALTVCVISLVFNFLAILNTIWGAGDPTLGVKLQIQRLGFLSYGAFFSLGIFLWFRFNSNLNVIYYLILSVLACVLEIFVHVAYVAYKSGVDQGNFLNGSLFPILIWLLVSFFCYFSLLNYTWFYRLSDSSRNFIQSLGMMTYPLYLVHFSFGVFLLDFFYSICEINSNFSFILTVACVLVVSYFVSKVFEPRLAFYFSSFYVWFISKFYKLSLKK